MSEFTLRTAKDMVPRFINEDGSAKDLSYCFTNLKGMEVSNVSAEYSTKSSAVYAHKEGDKIVLVMVDLNGMVSKVALSFSKCKEYGEYLMALAGHAEQVSD